MEFKRFSKDKQEQVRQFVAYAQMMGLTGKDIRSIGDKLDRMRLSEERKQNLEIVKGYNCLPIGNDRMVKPGKYLEERLDYRFKLKAAQGAYNFVIDYNQVAVTNVKTKVKVTFPTAGAWDYELGNNLAYSRRIRYGILLLINAGQIQLNF